MKRIWALALGIILALAPAFAVPTSEPAGAATTAGTAETATTSTSGTASISAGEVLEVNLDVTSLSKYWAGFYGQLTESVVIGSGSSIFYSWTITTPQGYIYVTTHQDFNWAGVSTTLPTDADVNADLSDALGANADWAPGADEGVAATFATQDTTGTYCSETGAYYVLTNSWNGTSYTASWPTCVYTDNQTPKRILFEAKIQNDQNSFKGTQVDYQALVPATTAGAVAYYFYKG